MPEKKPQLAKTKDQLEFEAWFLEVEGWLPIFNFTDCQVDYSRYHNPYAEGAWMTWKRLKGVSDD
jgi:hypothetical protein